MAISGLYKIINKENGKYYIGSAIDIKARWGRHKSELKHNKHHCIYLQRAWNKYGSNNFVFEIVEECEEVIARKLEQEILDTQDVLLYNVSGSASGGDLISNHPNKDSILDKITNHLINWMNNLTDSERLAIYSRKGEENGMYGKTHTPQARQKISNANKGHSRNKGAKRNEETKKKLSKIASERVGNENPFFGKHHSEETKKKLSEANKGKPPTNRRSIGIGGIIYQSIAEASRQLGIDKSLIIYRLKSKKYTEYIYID